MISRKFDFCQTPAISVHRPLQLRLCVLKCNCNGVCSNITNEPLCVLLTSSGRYGMNSSQRENCNSIALLLHFIRTNYNFARGYLLYLICDNRWRTLRDTNLYSLANARKKRNTRSSEVQTRIPVYSIAVIAPSLIITKMTRQNRVSIF